MKIIIVLAVVAAFLVAYVVWIRPYLKSLPSLANAWQSEDTTWEAMKAWLEGRKTILVGLWGSVIGFAPDVLQVVAGADLKTALHLPDNWAIIISGITVPLLMLIFRAKAKDA